MMNHEHNPIAVRIGKLQETWFRRTEKNPDYALARWVVHGEDVDLLNGFLKLEASPHGKLADFFVVLFTRFVTKETFAKELVQDWIIMYKEQLQNNDKHAIWNYAAFEEKLKTLSQEDKGVALLLEMLQDFSVFASEEKRPLVLTLIPRTVTNNDHYMDWFFTLLNDYSFPSSIKFAILDDAERNYFSRVTKMIFPKVIDIIPGNMDMRGAVAQLAAQGDPNDPQVQFRVCMLKMGEATSNNTRSILDEWGEKLIQAAVRSHDKSMLASGYLIYAGFLMHFPAQEETQKMLEKALQMAKNAVKEDAKNIPVLIQVYGYLGALASMHGEHKEAIVHFIKQAEISEENKLFPMALSAYKTIVYLGHTHNYTQEYEAYTAKGYEVGLQMEDDSLGVTDYCFIAHHYIELNENKDKNQVIVLKERMERLFGSQWREELVYRLKESVPEKKESES